MKKIKINHLFILSLIGLFSLSCSEKNISESNAISQIESYLENNLTYETTNFDFGEVKFKGKTQLLKSYKEMDSLGYIEMQLEKGRKRFLSKDSTYTYIVKLTDKSGPFVLEKDSKRAKVKTYYYELDKSVPIHIEQKGKTKVVAKVSLKKQQTDFARFSEDKNPHSTFTKQEFSFKLDKEGSWSLVK